MSVRITKEILSWKTNRKMECQSFGSVKERGIQVALNALLLGLLFSVF